MTTYTQEQTYKIAVAGSEATRQSALAAAKAAYNNTPAAWPAYDAAIKAADVAHVRNLIAFAAANGFGDGPRQTLHDLTGSFT